MPIRSCRLSPEVEGRCVPRLRRPQSLLLMTLVILDILMTFVIYYVKSIQLVGTTECGFRKRKQNRITNKF